MDNSAGSRLSHKRVTSAARLFCRKISHPDFAMPPIRYRVRGKQPQPQPDLAEAEGLAEAEAVHPDRDDAVVNRKMLTRLIEELLKDRNLDTITFKDFVNELESALTLQPGGLDEWRMEIRTIVDKKVRKEMNRQMLESVKKKRKIAPDTCQIKAAQTSQVLLVYLITWTPSADEEVSREVVFERLRECLEASQVNRSAESRSSIEKCCVFKEPHKSGKPHYHAALKLTGSTRWKPWKEALASTYSMVVNFSTCDRGWLGLGALMFHLQLNLPKDFCRSLE